MGHLIIGFQEMELVYCKLRSKVEEKMIVKKSEELIANISRYDKVVVFGMENIAKTVYRYLQKENVADKVIGFAVYNKVRRGKKKTIFKKKIKALKEYNKEKENLLVVVAVAPGNQDKALAFLKEQEYKEYVVIDYDLYCQLSKEEHVHIDFLCAGFTKCGTTSLHYALIKNKQIALPKGKETKYFLWRGKYEDSPTRFREKFYNEIKENQTVGLIDPSFHENAKEAYECFGKDLKVILMMRNPVDATYSNFKMRMRRTKHKSYVDYYKDTKVFNVEMFGKYIDHAVIGGKDERYRYTDCVEEYINYFGRENVKLVIFEEIISDTKRIMKEIQEFIGVTPKVYTKLPHSNSGKEVSKNYRCAKINRNLHRLRISLKGKNLPTLCKWERNLEKKIFKKTMMEFHEGMLPKHREVLENFYREDIKRLEHILGRSLEGIWY